MNKKKIFITIVALLLIVGIAVPSALAYFSTYVRVKGGVPVTLGESTQLKEEKTPDGGKHVVITAAEGSDPVFIRVKAFAPSDVQGLVNYEGEGWTEEDGYWYYGESIKDGESASIDITVDTDSLEDRDEFDLIVVYEYVPAQADGETLYADWDMEYKYTEEAA